MNDRLMELLECVSENLALIWLLVIAQVAALIGIPASFLYLLCKLVMWLV